MNNQSERQIQPAGINSDPDLIPLHSLAQVQESPCFLSKFLFLHHLTAAIHYLANPISNSSLLRYTKQYDKFIPTTRLRDIAMQKNLKGEKFQAFTSIIETQLGAVVLIVILSLLASGCSVVTIYYQQSLVLKIITQVNDEQYKFVGIVIGLVCARFLLFNYLIALTANVALNIKVHLENLYMRVIFMVDGHQIHTPINKFRFLDIQSVQEGFVLLPYVLVSFFTVAGVIVLIFVLNGKYGLIVLGIFLFFVLILIVLLVVTYRQLKRSEDRRIKITKKSKYLFQSLLSMLFQNLTSALLKKLSRQKDQSIKEDRFVNRAYSFIQLATDSAIVVPVIIYYGLLHNKTSAITLQNTYLTAVYLGMTYFLLKVFVFGCFYIVKAIQNYSSLLQELQLFNKDRLKDLNKNVYSQNSHAFCEDIGSCFEYEYDLFHMPRYVSKQSLKMEKEMMEKGVLQKQPQNDTLNLSSLFSIPNTRSVVLCGGVESEATMQLYLDKLKQQISKNYSLVVIDENYLLAPETYRDNIIFYQQFNEQASKRLNHVLELTDLIEFKSQAQRQAGYKVSESLAKVYTWHTPRLELARALYQQVDYLIIDKFTLTQDSHLIRTVLQERNKNNKFTILVNRNNFQLLKMVDRIGLFIQGQPRPQTHTFYEIAHGASQKWLQVFKKLETSLVEKYSSSEHFKQEYLQLSKKPQQELVIAGGLYFSFFSLAHSGAAIVIILVFATPPCFKFYMAYLIGQSLKQDIFSDYLIFGVIYLVLVLLRGLVLTGYLGEATKQLFKQTVATFSQLTGTQILSTYKNKDSTIEADFRNIDNHFVMNFEMGLTGTLETLISIIIAAVGQPIFLAISLPVVLVSFIFTGIYVRLNRSLQKLKTRHIKHVKNFVNFCTVKSKQLLFLRKYQEVERRFVELNRLSLLFDANSMWILSGVRMLGELLFLIGFVIFLVIMVETQAKKVSNLPMVSLGVSLFLNLNLGFRFSINNIRLLEEQLLSISKIMSRLKDNVHQQQKAENIVDQSQVVPELLQKITYQKLMVRVEGDAWLQPLQFTINRGDRISVSYDSRALAHIIFFALNPQVIGSNQSGDILINENIHIRKYNLKVFYLHSFPLIPFKGNVLQACRFLRNNIEEDSLQKQLSSFFEQIGINQLFDCKTEMFTMPLAFRQIFNVFKVVWLQQCDVLVVMSGLDEVDTISRISIEKFLAKSSIPVVISITNIPSIEKLYKKRFELRSRKLTPKYEAESSVGKIRQQQ